MERDFDEKLKRDQQDRLTVKKGEVKFLTTEEIKKLQTKYSTFGGKGAKKEK